MKSNCSKVEKFNQTNCNAVEKRWDKNCIWVQIQMILRRLLSVKMFVFLKVNYKLTVPLCCTRTHVDYLTMCVTKIKITKSYHVLIWADMFFFFFMKCVVLKYFFTQIFCILTDLEVLQATNSDMRLAWLKFCSLPQYLKSYQTTGADWQVGNSETFPLDRFILWAT